MKVWKVFAGSRKARIICFALAGALLVVSTVGLGYSVAAPTEGVPTAKYEHRGEFDYTVYLKPNILYGDVVLRRDWSSATNLIPASRWPILLMRWWCR